MMMGSFQELQRRWSLFTTFGNDHSDVTWMMMGSHDERQITNLH